MAISWVEKGSLKGVKGDTGERGERGLQGYSFRTVNTALSASATVQMTNITPSTNVQEGDKLIDSNSDVWEVVTVAADNVTVGAAAVGSIKGAKGDQGEQGPAGEVEFVGTMTSRSSLTPALRLRVQRVTLVRRATPALPQPFRSVPFQLARLALRLLSPTPVTRTQPCLISPFLAVLRALPVPASPLALLLPRLPVPLASAILT